MSSCFSNCSRKGSASAEGGHRELRQHQAEAHRDVREEPSPDERDHRPREERLRRERRDRVQNYLYFSMIIHKSIYIDDDIN